MFLIVETKQKGERGEKEERWWRERGEMEGRERERERESV
jgi:hypothetical protein